LSSYLPIFLGDPAGFRYISSMERLINWLAKNRIFLDISLIVLLVAGILSAMNARKEGFPEISLNKYVIQTRYPGASPSDVAANVTEVIEDEVAQVEGIKEILSYSEDSLSRIEVQGFEELNPKQREALYSDLENALAQVDELPAGIKGRPVLTEIKTSDAPVLEIAYEGEYSVLKPYLESLSEKVRNVRGVKDVILVGVPDEEIHILIDSTKALRYGLDIRDIARRVAGRNLDGSGGLIVTANGEKKIVMSEKVQRAEEILDTELRSNDMGYLLKLRDIATVQRVPEDVKLIVRNNGKAGAIMVVQKTGSGDLIQTVQDVLEVISSERLPESVHSKVLLDQSTLTRDRLNLLISNSIMGFILVFLVLIVFLNLQSAVLTSLAIPVTLLALLVFLKAANISLNLISLGGFIIIIGMLVDGAVVVAEEFSMNRHKGLAPVDAAVKASMRMWAPILASTVTTVIAFAPLFIVEGYPGAFIKTIPLMVIIGLGFAFFITVVVMPVYLITGGETKLRDSKWIITLEKWYRNTLLFSLKHTFLVLGLFTLIVFLSMALMAFKVKKDPFPQDAAESFYIKLTFPRGYTSSQTTKALTSVEAVIDNLPAEELLGYSSRVGTHSPLSYTDRGNQNNLVTLFVYLTGYQNRERTANQIISHLRKELSPIKESMGLDFSINLNRLGPPMGRDLEVRIISGDEAKRIAALEDIRSYISGLPGVLETESDLTNAPDEIVVKLNHRLLNLSGLTVEDVLSAMKISLDGRLVSDISSGKERLEFRVKLQEKNVTRNLLYKEKILAHDKGGIPILNNFGNSIQLSQFVNFEERKADSSVNTIDGTRSNTIFANLDTSLVSPVDIMNNVKARYPGDETLRVDFSGQPVETQIIFSGLGLAGLLAVIGIYLTIALIFNSYSRPVVIMLSLPYLVIGIVGVLVTHNIPGSMMVGIAIVGLLGVVVNTSIILVDSVSLYNENGVVDRAAIIEGSVSRLRPVLMTVITTVLGVLPTGYGIGGSDPFLSHMSLVLGYGLLFATFVILLVVPLMLKLQYKVSSDN